MTLFKLSISTMEKSSFVLHAPSVTCRPYKVSSSLVTLRPRCLASFFDMKLCVALVSSNARTTWPLMVTLIYMRAFFVGVDMWLLSAPRHWREPMLDWDSFIDGMEWPLSHAARH